MARSTAARRKTTRPVLQLEALEDRTVPAVITVNTLVDETIANNGLTSLREAITQAFTRPEADTIQFAVAGTINLGGPLPDLTGQLTIDGSTAASVTVRRYSGGVYRVFFVAPSANVDLFGLTIAGGSTGNYPGGGGFNDGRLLVSHRTLTDNSD